jgi:TonB-dependent SusC/RagA subfamily outer membrane receptor
VAISLADYLKRVPGVQVMQSASGVQVTVRGANSLAGNLEPLFVVDGVNVGFGYEKAEPLVPVADIASVQVLKSGQETASYGMQGTNGVIVIRTKRK